MIKDALGDRIKSNYEDRFRYKLPRRTYTIIRVDGKSFSNYTKKLVRPFDDGFMEDMDATAAYLCKNISGAKLAFVQSDEISVLVTDFEDSATDSWFDSNLQKMCSVSASMATAKFNQLRMIRACSVANIDEKGTEYKSLSDKEIKDLKIAEFDARIFQIPQKVEVFNYLVWRQNDTTRNSINSVANSFYPDKELKGKNSNEKQEMIFQKGINWNDYASRYKRGRLIIKETYTKDPNDDKGTTSIRSRWVPIEIPKFTAETDFLMSKIPDNV